MPPGSPGSVRRALITGIAGQDAGYLAEQLLGDGYRVFGLVRADARARAEALPWLAGVDFVEGDLRDGASIDRAIDDAAPDELYNLASNSVPARSWDEAEASAEVNALGPLRVLEALRRRSERDIRLCQAGSSEIFGDAPNPQNELTPARPTSPYGAAKAYAHHVVATYRARYGLFGCTVILYNHESERRPDSFVTRKITRAAARIKLGKERALLLGSLDARRDWGYAPDYTRAMRLALSADEPDDYVIGTGQTHTVGELAEAAFARVGLDYRDYVRLDPRFVGGTTYGLEADATRAHARLGWQPTVNFEEMVAMMVDHDLAAESACP